MGACSHSVVNFFLAFVFLAASIIAGCSGCTSSTTPPKLLSIVPSEIPGNTKLRVTLLGEHFSPTTQFKVGKSQVSPLTTSSNEVTFETPKLARGQYKVISQNEFGLSNSILLQVNNSVPTILAPGPQLVKTGTTLRLEMQAKDLDGDLLNFKAIELPINSTFDAETKMFSWQTSEANVGNHVVRIRVSDTWDSAEIRFEINVMSKIPKPMIEKIEPGEVRGNTEARIRITGRNLTQGDLVVFETLPLETQVLSRNTVEAILPPQKRGKYQVHLRRSDITTEHLPIEILNSIPQLSTQMSLSVDEYQELEYVIPAQDFDGDPTRIFVSQLPPGARFDAESHTVSFEPDFIQGGKTYKVKVLVWDGQDIATSTMAISVNDSVSPPFPTIQETESFGDHTRIRLQQITDSFLEPANTSGREYDARIVIPDRATPDSPLPVRVYLHGFGGGPYNGGQGDQFRIYPHDPDNTYWWGMKDESSTPNFTQRRVLHLVEWVLKNYPGADPNRVYVTGPSMGGAGAAELGILNARHFALVEATIGQMIPRNHRPARIRQLSEHWGSPSENFDSGNGTGVWDQQDITLAFERSEESRNQFIFTRHGKDDPTIHFGAVVHASPRTMQNYYQAIQFHKVGHVAVWDEGGHGPADPTMGSNWWTSGWNRMFDSKSFLRRNLAFPAFSNSDSDETPGDGSPNGLQTWDDTRGYAGTVSVAGDTGWNGDRVGVFNRYFRWDSTRIIDRWDRFEIPLKVNVSAAQAATEDGYPAIADEYKGTLPITSDVTIRRIQAFHCRVGEAITWSYGQASGIVRVNELRTITIPTLSFTTEYKTLKLTRTLD